VASGSVRPRAFPSVGTDPLTIQGLRHSLSVGDTSFLELKGDKEMKKKTTKAAAAAFPTYRRKGAFPSMTPTVKIYFGGIMLFFFDGKDGCEIGVHNATHPILGPAHPQPHDFKLGLQTTILGSPSAQLSIPLPASPKSWPADITIHVERPSTSSGIDGVFVFAPKHTPSDEFDRTNAAIDSRDWRWLLDLEGPDFYQPLTLDKNPDLYTPRIHLDNGLFYTNYRTRSKFKRRLAATQGTDDYELGFVGESAAANIYLEPGGLVLAQMNGMPIVPPLPSIPGITYELYISNGCRGGVPQCRYEPGSPDPTMRNDFYLYYDLLRLDATVPRYELWCYDPQGGRISTPLHMSDLSMTSTDPAPCGPGGSGGSSGGG
jgi:hypothetical protein